MQKFFCYATVFQAIELFSLARSEKEYAAIEDAMSALKLLGLNPKNAKKYGALLDSAKGVDRWNVLIAGLCIDSRLPLLTDQKKGFRRMKELLVVPTRLLTEQKSAEDVLHAARDQAGTGSHI
jgi:predicted nucleic acid-binding protein